MKYFEMVKVGSIISSIILVLKKPDIQIKTKTGIGGM